MYEITITIPPFITFKFDNEEIDRIVRGVRKRFLLSNKDFDLIPIFEHYAENQLGGWRFIYSTKDEIYGRWTYRGLAFLAYAKACSNACPIYQYFAVNHLGEWRFHYSTVSDYGRGWTRQSIAFYAYADPYENSVPVYAYYAINQEGGWRYHYSTDPNVGQGWTQERIAFYAFPT